MRQLKVRIDADRSLQQRRSKFGVVQLDLGVTEVNQGLGLVRVVGQFGLELNYRLIVLPLSP
jgi:hypothetical protein